MGSVCISPTLISNYWVILTESTLCGLRPPSTLTSVSSSNIRSPSGILGKNLNWKLQNELVKSKNSFARYWKLVLTNTIWLWGRITASASLLIVPSYDCTWPKNDERRPLKTLPSVTKLNVDAFASLTSSEEHWSGSTKIFRTYCFSSIRISLSPREFTSIMNPFNAL